MLVLRGSYLVVVWVCPNESACRVDYTPLHYTSTFQQKNQPKYLECTKRHRENNEKLGWNFARSNRQNMRINGYQFSLFLGQKHKPSSFPQLCDLILLETVSPMYCIGLTHDLGKWGGWHFVTGEGTRNVVRHQIYKKSNSLDSRTSIRSGLIRILAPWLGKPLGWNPN